ncbi:MAG: PilW family protein [Candidatus Berkiella sp.]
MMQQQHCQGFSLIEAMIAIVLSLILLAGVLQIFLNNKNIYNLGTGFSQLQENGRFTSAYMARTIRFAGYRSTPATGNFPSMTTTYPTSASYITGTSNNGQNGSDTFTIRYQGSGDGAGNPDGTVRDCLNRPIDANVIATNTFSLTANNELQCQAVNASASPSNSTQVLINGVENMHVLYGEDLNNDNTADRYVGINFPGLNLSKIVSMRLSLLLKSDEAIKPTATSITYNLLGTTYTPTADQFLRQQVTFTVLLRNQVSKPF